MLQRRWLPQFKKNQTNDPLLHVVRFIAIIFVKTIHSEMNMS